MDREQVDVIRWKYDHGIYTLRDVFDLVSFLVITKEQFHSITSFSYDGLKKNRGW